MNKVLIHFKVIRNCTHFGSLVLNGRGSGSGSESPDLEKTGCDRSTSIRQHVQMPLILNDGVSKLSDKQSNKNYPLKLALRLFLSFVKGSNATPFEMVILK